MLSTIYAIIRIVYIKKNVDTHSVCFRIKNIECFQQIAIFFIGNELSGLTL